MRNLLLVHIFFRHMFTRSFWQCAPHIVRHVPGFEVFDAHWCIYCGPTSGCAKKFILTDSKLEPQFFHFFHPSRLEPQKPSKLRTSFMPKVLILTVGVTPTNYEGRAIFLHTSNLLSFQLGRSAAATLANSNPQVTVQIQTHIFKSHCGCLPKIQLHTISSTCRGLG